MSSLLGALLPAPRTDRPRNASPVPLALAGGGPGWASMLSPADKLSQLRAMGGVGTLYSVVQRITTAVSAVDWHLYRKAKSGLAEDRTEVTSHACIDLWEQPNPHYTRPQLMEASGQHWELTGEAPIVISRHPAVRSLPLELWPIRPDRIEPEPDPRTFIARYWYRSPDGQQLPLELDEVLRLLTPCPWDPYRGLGVVQTILIELDGSRATAEWNRQFFRNSARPGGVVQYDDLLEDTDYERIVAHWRDQHQGLGNAHRVAIIEGGKWIDSKFSLRDLQFTELRQAGRDVILEGWGVHKASLGITDDVNRAASVAAKALFAEDIIVPRLKKWRELLNTRLLPMYGPDAAQRLEWDFDNPVPPDAEAVDRERASKTTAWKALVDAGADPDEAADAVGLPRGLVKVTTPPAVPPAPAGNGDRPAAAGELNINLAVTQPRPAPPAPRPRAATHRHRRPRAVAEPGTPPPGVPAEDPDAVDAVDLGPVQAAWEAALGALLAAWSGSVVAGWISDLADQIRAILAGTSSRGLADLTVQTGDAVDLVTDALVDLASTAADHAAAEAAEHHDVTLTPASPARGDLEDHAQIVVDLLGRVYELSAGREAGRVAGPDADPDEVADRVTAHLASLTDAEPERELGAALTSAQNQARAATLGSGPVGALYASEQMDSNTCAPCRAIHGRWIANTDDLGPLHVLYPTAGYVDCLGRQRCRGTVVGVWRQGTEEDS